MANCSYCEAHTPKDICERCRRDMRGRWWGKPGDASENRGMPPISIKRKNGRAFDIFAGYHTQGFAQKIGSVLHKKTRRGYADGFYASFVGLDNSLYPAMSEVYDDEYSAIVAVAKEIFGNQSHLHLIPRRLRAELPVSFCIFCTTPNPINGDTCQRCEDEDRAETIRSYTTGSRPARACYCHNCAEKSPESNTCPKCRADGIEGP